MERTEATEAKVLWRVIPPTEERKKRQQPNRKTDAQRLQMRWNSDIYSLGAPFRHFKHIIFGHPPEWNEEDACFPFEHVFQQFLSFSVKRGLISKLWTTIEIQRTMNDQHKTLASNGVYVVYNNGTN